MSAPHQTSSESQVFAGRRRKARPGFEPDLLHSPEAESPPGHSKDVKRSRRKERNSEPFLQTRNDILVPTLSELAAISSQLLAFSGDRASRAGATNGRARPEAETLAENEAFPSHGAGLSSGDGSNNRTLPNHGAFSSERRLPVRRRPSQIRVKKDNWRQERRSGSASSPGAGADPDAVGASAPHDYSVLAALRTTAQAPSSPTNSVANQAERDAQIAQERALRYVRAAERDRQRILQLPSYEANPPPLDEYHCSQDIPPYQAQLHRYLDLISYDERFAPVLRVNRYLVPGDGDLSVAITKFGKFNLLPQRTDLWSISHVDDNEYERLIPALIPEESY